MRFRLGQDVKMVLPHRFEIGRNNATTLLWTEDWIGSGVAWQHSYYASCAPSNPPREQYLLTKPAATRRSGLHTR